MMFASPKMEVGGAQKEFGIDPEEAKENFPDGPGDSTTGSKPTRHRPGNLPSLGIETDLCYEL